MKLLSAWLLPVAVLAAACDVRVDEHGIQSLRISEGRAEDVWTASTRCLPTGRWRSTGENGAIEVRASGWSAGRGAGGARGAGRQRRGGARAAAEAADQ